MASSIQKPRVIKDFEKLDTIIQEQIKLTYPTGFYEHLITYSDKDGNEKYALPFETDDKYYMVRMSINEAKRLVSNDDDYDDNGILRNDVQEHYQEKYQDIDYLAEFDDIEDLDLGEGIAPKSKKSSKKSSKNEEDEDLDDEFDEDEDEDFDDDDDDDKDFDDDDFDDDDDDEDFNDEDEDELDE